MLLRSRWLKTFCGSERLGLRRARLGASPFFASVVQLLSRVQLFATLWTAACQASLSFKISQSLPKLMSIELVMPSDRLVLCVPFSIFALKPLTEGFWGPPDHKHRHADEERAYGSAGWATVSQFHGRRVTLYSGAVSLDRDPVVSSSCCWGPAQVSAHEV